MLAAQRERAHIAYFVHDGVAKVTVCHIYFGAQLVASGQSMCKPEGYNEEVGKKQAFAAAMKGWMRRKYFVTESMNGVEIQPTGKFSNQG